MNNQNKRTWKITSGRNLDRVEILDDGRKIGSKAKNFNERKMGLMMPDSRAMACSPSSQGRNKTALASEHSVINLMREVEKAMWADKHSAHTESLLGTFKEELDRNLFYPPPRSGNKEKISKPKKNLAKKRIRISEHSDVRGFLEMMQGTREYNWKTKSVIQHRPCESPWFQSLMPKNRAGAKVIVVPEVDTTNEIVDSFVEKELKRCGGVPNVIKASRRNFTTERLKLRYEKSAIETYSPIGNECDVVNDLILKLGIPFTDNKNRRPGITLSATDLTCTKSILKSKSPPKTPLTPLIEKKVKFVDSSNKKAKDRKKKMCRKSRIKNAEWADEAHRLLDRLKKQSNSKTISKSLNLKEAQEKMSNIKESASVMPLKSIYYRDEPKIDEENYLMDFVSDSSKKKVNVDAVLSTLLKLQDVLENFPPELEEDYCITQNVKDSLLQKIAPLDLNNGTFGDIDIKLKLQDLIKDVKKPSKENLMNANKESKENGPQETVRKNSKMGDVLSYYLSFPWEKRVFVSPATGKIIGYTKIERIIRRYSLKVKCFTIVQYQALRFAKDISYSAVALLSSEGSEDTSEVNLSRYLKNILSKRTVHDLPNKVSNFLRDFSVNTIQSPRRVLDDDIFNFVPEEENVSVYHCQVFHDVPREAISDLEKYNDNTTDKTSKPKWELFPFEVDYLFSCKYQNYINQTDINSNLINWPKFADINTKFLLKFIEIICKRNFYFNDNILNKIRYLIELASQIYGLEYGVRNIFDKRMDEVLGPPFLGTGMEGYRDELNVYLKNSILLDSRKYPANLLHCYSRTSKMVDYCLPLVGQLFQNPLFKCLYIVTSIIFLFVALIIFLL